MDRQSIDRLLKYNEMDRRFIDRLLKYNGGSTMSDVIQAVLDRQADHQEQLRTIMIMKDRNWSQMRRVVRERLGLPQLPEDIENDDD